MRAVVQRVTQASVKVDGQVVGCIGANNTAGGFLVLLGVMDGDTPAEAQLLAAKVAALRVFCDEQGKMNRSLLDTGGSCLVVSQFTLCADCKKGNRPSFSASAPAQEADRLYELFQQELRDLGVRQVESGVFAADMQVELCNDGPVTILLDTDIWTKKAGTN